MHQYTTQVYSIFSSVYTLLQVRTPHDAIVPDLAVIDLTVVKQLATYEGNLSDLTLYDV
jgi:hypothetical protein